MNRFFKLYAPPLLLFFLMCATLCFASDTWNHVCRFHEHFKEDHSLSLVQELPTSPTSTWAAYTATSTESWEPIRILMSTADLHKTEKSCHSEGQKVTDFLKNEMTCSRYQITKPEGKNAVQRSVRSAVQMHAARLKVQPIKYGFKVPTLKGDFCSGFTVSESHKETGVLNADMVLYVAPLVSKTIYSKIIAAPCAALSNGRPVVGGILYSFFYDAATPYYVRVAAHEIAHALGFSYNVFSKNTGVKLANKTGVRQKPQVTEVTGTNTVDAVKKHFNCPTATGMELEDEMGKLKVISHSHWERRNARDDLMAPVVDKGLYSALTLALFNDLGYYQAKMDEAEPMEWGLNAGCDFLTKPCITNGKTTFPKYFCTDIENHYCNDNREMVQCSARDLSESTVPTHLNYFSDNKINLLSAFVDNCPLFVRNLAVNCKRDANGVLPGIKKETSLCFKKASGSTKIWNDEKYKGMCVAVEATESKEVQIMYREGVKVTCTNGKATLGGNFNGVILECPTADDLIREKKKNEETILLKENEVNYAAQEEVIKVIHKTKQQQQPEEKVMTPTIQNKNQTQSVSTPNEKSATTEQSKGKSVDKKSGNTELNSQVTSSGEANMFPKTEEKRKDKNDKKLNHVGTKLQNSENFDKLDHKKDGSSTYFILLPLILIFAAITENVLAQ